MAEVKIAVIDARPEHVMPIVRSMREADRDELAASGSDPAGALYQSLKVSTWVKTVMVDEVPAIMFGVAPVSVLSGIGSPWLLGTDAVLKIRRPFLRGCGDYVKQMLRIYPVLHNAVDARNLVSIAWLRRLGFALLPPEKLGVNGELFHPFRLERHCV